MKNTKKKKKNYKNTWGTPLGQDCISLNSTLCGWLAPRLEFLARYTNGVPMGYKDHKRWTKDLKKQAKRLEVYYNYYHGKNEVADKKLHNFSKIHDDADKAMMWVAKNFQNLWD